MGVRRSGSKAVGFRCPDTGRSLGRTASSVAVSVQRAGLFLVFSLEEEKSVADD